MLCHPARAVVLVLALLVAVPAGAAAQGFGLGPRLSLVRGDYPSETPSTRFLGGIVRIRSSKRVVIELAADYRTELAGGGLTRVKERPLQGSMLLFPMRARLAPYVLAGYGLYVRTIEILPAEGQLPLEPPVIERRTGAHMGFGAELFLSRHAAFVLDYRYRFVRFGAAAPGEEPVNFPGLGSHLSHRGSMWTSGLAFYF